jgi:hypothetical protein
VIRRSVAAVISAVAFSLTSLARRAYRTLAYSSAPSSTM